MKIIIEKDVIEKNYKEYVAPFFNREKPISLLAYIVMMPFIVLGMMIFLISSIFTITFIFEK